jgi:DNA-directed RNA polymerase subunit E"
MKACKNCKFIVKVADKCPMCQSEELSEKFIGLIAIIDVEKSKVAKELNIKNPGEYALIVK